MKIKASKVNDKDKEVNKRFDTVYMDTDVLHCSYYQNKSKVPNLKTIIIPDKLVKSENYIEIFDTNATNLYFEECDNIDGITIDCNYFYKKSIYLEITNDYKDMKFKQINIKTYEGSLIVIDLEENLSQIKIYDDEGLNIDIYDNKKIIYYNIGQNNETRKTLYSYYLNEDDLNEFGELDIRNLNKYETIACKRINIKTLIVDKNIFKEKDKFYALGLHTKYDYSPNIKNIRIIDDDSEMKLFPFDKTFEIDEILLDDSNKKYLYIKTKADEVVLYLDDNDNIKYISKNDLLKDNDIKTVNFRFRKQIRVKEKFLKPLSFIIKEYKDGLVEIFDLDKNIKINEEFKNNMLSNKEKLKCDFETLFYIESNDWLKLLNSENFSDNLLKKMKLLNFETENIKDKVSEKGLNNKAINYLRYRGLLESISKVKLLDYEIDAFNEIGERYTKILKK